ncbi:MAG: DHH family phosphoesterase [archaeon]
MNARFLAEKLNIPFEVNTDKIELFDGMILVDLNSEEMLGSMKKAVLSSKKPVFLIDHHLKPKKLFLPEKFSLINEKRVSSTEIVFELLKENHFPIDSKTSSLLACGIITDSAGFTVADSKTFSMMSLLLKKSNLSFFELKQLFFVPMDESQRIAKLKAAKRLNLLKMGKHLIVTTTVGSFEADAASALIRLGASLAFAGNSDKGRIRISARANNAFVNETGIDLVKDVFSVIEKEFKGNSGGHRAAAAFNGKGKEIETPLKRCIELTENYFKKKSINSTKKYYD